MSNKIRNIILKKKIIGGVVLVFLRKIFEIGLSLDLVKRKNI